ncbi:hypothetical protein SSPO_022340 [Streptomyces antimycoticus]|uniref:DUF4346 domain-containing protein n=1 Tax=Streptomyces antimycoticus TaxID=68175 RepID=A0A499USK5_9ACTN|nr:hypothetical protein [Streptomyces antimycoticus]BBJ39516.1 hypothetical protein SSPO_022340 [Streptomyces antimycoticus]
MVNHRPADVAVCTLRTHTLPARLTGHPRVAVAAPLATANLGIEELVRGALARPAVRHLVVCGHDSRVFHPGQSLLALAAHGTAPDGTIIGADGHRAHLPNLRPPVVAAFRRRIAVHDLRGQDDPAAVLAAVDALPRHADGADGAGDVNGDDGVAGVLGEELAASTPRLVPLAAVGRVRPIASAGGGCFVISLDRPAGRIVLRHYGDDLASGHELRSRSATALTLAAVAHGLTDDPAHAGYLGGELAKAETALRLGLAYVQDRPLDSRSADPVPSLHWAGPVTAEPPKGVAL